MPLKTVAIVCVNNCMVQENDERACNYLVKDIHLLDYQVQKIVYISESKYVLAQEVQQLTKQCDIIIIIGELSNGIVYKGISLALYQNLVPNEELIKVYEKCKGKYTKEEISIPGSAQLLSLGNLDFPVIDANRIFILHKNYVEKLYANILRNYLVEYSKAPLYTKSIYVQKNGKTQQHLLQYTTSNISTKFEDIDSKIVCTVSSNSFSDIVNFEYQIMQSNIPYLGSFDPTPVNSEIYTKAKPNVQRTIQHIKESLERYGPENVFLSFNGGKDCTVLLHLIINIIKINYPNYNKKIYCLYVRSENAFQEQDAFIMECQLYYNLEIVTLCAGIKEALETVLQQNSNLKAVFMGTRRTDPFSANLKNNQMTDPNWPQVMRINPILDWHYSDIWDYLLFYKVPYCKLYDMGYTSLGNSTNTIRNPSLKYYDIVADKDTYLPAYKLLNEVKERSGRNT